MVNQYGYGCMTRLQKMLYRDSLHMLMKFSRIWSRTRDDEGGAMKEPKGPKKPREPKERSLAKLYGYVYGQYYYPTNGEEASIGSQFVRRWRAC